MTLVYEQLAEDIRTVLTAEVDPSEEAMRELDTRYTEAVNEVNLRLRDCGGLLDNGLRTEAIQKCEAEPNLLDIVAIVDFPEFDVWADYVKQYGFAGSPRVFSAIAEQLNDAYNEEASLGTLLRKHRLHALLRSPLSTRLNVLRALAHRDSGTPIWQEDVKAYELVRHDQLKAEIKDAYARGDLSALAMLEQEVRSDAWRQKPPKDIVERATRYHTTLRVKTARQQLEELVGKLTDAYSAFDVDRGRQLRSRWHAQAAIALSRDDDPLLELAAPALEWLDEQDRQEQEEADYAAAAGALNQALDDWASQQELERLYYTLQSFDREIDRALASRMEERFAALADTARRRSRLIAVGAVAMIALVGGVIAFGIYTHSRATVLAQHVATLRQHVQAENTPEAEAFLEKLENSAPEVFSNPEIQELAGQTRRIREAEQGRRARFQQLLASARSAGTTWEGYGDALSRINDAERTVKNDFERADIARARGEVESAHQQLQKEYDDKFAADLSDYAVRCDEADKTELNALKQLMEEGALLSQRERVSRVLVAQVKPLVQRLTAEREAELRSRDETELVAAIDRAVGDRAAFQLAMETYVEAFPDKSQTVTFKRVLENETKLWDGMDAWNAFLQSSSQRDYRELSAARAAELIAEAAAIIEQHPGFPAETNVKRLVQYMTPITKRVDDEGKSKHLILTDQLTQNIPNMGMVLVSVSDAANIFNRYYFNLAKPMREVGSNFSLDHFIDPGLQTTRITRFSPAAIMNRESADGKIDWTAPQTRFSKVALDQLADFRQTRWEAEFYELMSSLDDFPEMAPQVRVQLLGLFLTIGCEGSLPMTQAYAKHVSLLETANIPQPPDWVDPEDVAGTQTKNKASALLGRLGYRNLEPEYSARADMSPAVVGRRTAKSLLEMASPQLGDRYAWVGWLRKDVDLKWTVSFRQSFQAASGELYVIHTDSDDKPQLLKLGRLVAGELDLSAAPQQALLAGRPVYLVIP